MALKLQVVVRGAAPDVDGFFLATVKHATLGPAAARSVTDFHITGGKTAMPTMVTDTPSELVLDLDGVEHKVENGTVKLPSSLRINSTMSQVALAIDGTVANTMSGQASIPLRELFDNHKRGAGALAPYMYANWRAPSAVVQISAPRILDELGTALRVQFYEDPEAAAQSQEAEKVLEALYTSSVDVRQTLVPRDPKVKGLSKAVMRVPDGINSSTFDASCNVVDRPPSLTRSAFEQLAGAAMLREFAMDAEALKTFAADCARPCLKAAHYAPKVANAMSTVVASCCPYRVDGVTSILPNGVSLVETESWKAEAARNVLTADDCEGAGAIVTSQLYDALEVARDPELAAQLPYTAAFSNALAHHLVGICVLTANAGNADAADHTSDAVAGHAIALAMPRPAMLAAMGRSADALGANMDTSALKAAWASAMYDSKDIARFPVEERSMITEGFERASTFHKKLGADSGIVALAIEGTAPVAPSLLHEPDSAKYAEALELTKLDKQVAKKLGPTVTRAVSRLYTAPHGQGEHIFYKKMLEFSIPIRGQSFFTNPTMRSMGLATSQFVFTEGADPRVAGVSPMALAMEDYGVAALWRLNDAAAATLEAASIATKNNMMPMRAQPFRLNAHQTKTYTENLKVLEGLQTQATPHATAGGNPHNNATKTHTTEHLLTFAALANNRSAIDAFAARVREVGASVLVDTTPVAGVLMSEAGEDVGVMVTVNLETPVS